MTDMTERAFYQDLDDDAAADWTPEGGDYRGIPKRVKLPKMHLKAHDTWKEAYRRGLVSDIEMAYYTMLINRHPASWMGWLKGM